MSFAAELHLVHVEADGHLVVVALLFRLGEPSPVVQAILDAAPAAGDAVSAGTALNAGGYVTGGTRLLPVRRLVDDPSML